MILQQNSTDVRVNYFYDEDNVIQPIDVLYERHSVNPNGLIQLKNIPSPLHTVFTIIRRNGTNVIQYNKVESVVNQYDFMVDYINGILTFHSSQAGKEIQISYTNSIGQLNISADVIFTNIDNQGNIVQTLGTMIDEGRSVLSDLSVLGGASKVITELQGYIESARELTGNIIQGSNINTELKKSTDTAKSTNTTLNSTIINANNKISDMNNWVESHGDIINLDNRVGTAENKLNTVSQSLEEKASKTELDNSLVEKANKINNKLHFISSANTGDCTIIQLSDGKNMLIDSHASSNSIHTLDYINSLGITHFDYVVITHYHSDHVGNIVNLQDYFNENTTFYLPQDVDSSVVSSSIIENQTNVKAVAIAQGSIIIQPTENQKVLLPNKVVLEFINTNHSSYYASSSFDYNNCSLCFCFTSNNTEVFFSGDIGLEAQSFLKNKVRPVSIYKANHHSSDTFLDTSFITAILPEICICMDSNDVYYNLIANSRLQNWLQSNSIPVYPTSRNGDIVLLVNEAGYKFDTDCKAFTTQLSMYKYIDDKYVKKFLFQSFDEIFKNYNGTTYDNTKTLIEVLNAMATETTIQTTIPSSHSSCPSFISSYGAYITIEKAITNYCRIILTDRDPSNNKMWLGKWFNGDAEISWIEMMSKNSVLDLVYGIGNPLSSGSDLNNIGIGVYTSDSGTTTATLLNKPSDLTSGFRIEIKYIHVNNRIIQTIYPNNNGYFYIRNYTSLGWGSWYKYVGTVI